MSGVAIVRALLAADPNITAIVPAARIVAGILRQNAIIPAISVHKIYGSEESNTARNLRTKLVRQRVQVTVLAKDYATMERLMKLSALGSGVHTGIVVGFNVRSVLPWGENPEIPPGDDGIYEQSRDFMVTFIEAN